MTDDDDPWPLKVRPPNESVTRGHPGGEHTTDSMIHDIRQRCAGVSFYARSEMWWMVFIDCDHGRFQGVSDVFLDGLRQAMWRAREGFLRREHPEPGDD